MTHLKTLIAEMKEDPRESKDSIEELEREDARRSTHPLHDVALQHVAEEGLMEPDLESIRSKYGLNSSQARTILWYVHCFQDESDWLFERSRFYNNRDSDWPDEDWEWPDEGCPKTDDASPAEDESEDILTFDQLRAKYESERW